MEFKLVTEQDNLEYLKQVSKPFDFKYPPYDPEKLADIIFNYVKKAEAFGVSGVQLSFPYRVFGVFIEQKKFQIMFNPKLVSIVNDTEVNEKEGCLSFPNLFLNISRPKIISVEYQNTVGLINNIELSNYYARGFLHELDHLNGIVFTNHVGKLALKIARKKLIKKMKKYKQYKKD